MSRKLNLSMGYMYNRNTSLMTYTEKYITNKDDNIIQVRSISIILLIFMSDIFFCICLMRDVLVLLSTILYDL